MELDLVDAVAVAVERPQHGLVLVGEPSPLLLGLTAHETPERGGALAHPTRSLALDGLDKGHVAGEHVEPFEGRWLVEHGVRQPRRGAVTPGMRGGGHPVEVKQMPAPGDGCVRAAGPEGLPGRSLGRGGEGAPLGR